MLMLIALLLALFLESYFYSAENAVTVNIPAMVDVLNLPLERMIVDPPKGEKGIPVRVEVRGPRPLVEQVRSSNNKFGVDLPTTNPSEFTAFLDPQQLRLPAGVEVLSITPASVTIKTEPVAQRELLVEVQQVGSPDRGFEVDHIDVFPATVLVRGPQSRIEELRSIITYPVDVSNFRASERLETSLQVPDPLVGLSVSTVKVEVRVGPARKEHVFENIGIRVLAANGFAATVAPSRASATVSVPEVELAELSAGNMFLIADGRALPEGKHRVGLTADFGKNVRLLKTVPAEVTVTLVTKNE